MLAAEITLVTSRYRISGIEMPSPFGFKWFRLKPSPERNLLMQSKGVFPTRIELLNALDQEIGILMTKTFACFTPDERSEFKNRQERIRALEQELAFAQAEQIYDSGVFASIY
jgi:hypothetical protein